MTLLGGFASTVFIPLTHLLIEALGWRHALLALAASTLRFALHPLFVVPAQTRSAPAARVPSALECPPGPAGAGLLGLRRDRRDPGDPVHGPADPFHPAPRGARLHSSTRRWPPSRSSARPRLGARFTVGLAEGILGMRALGLLIMAIGVRGPRAPALRASRLLDDRRLCDPLRRGQRHDDDPAGRAAGGVVRPGADYGTILGMIAAPVRTSPGPRRPFAFGVLWAWWGSYDAVVLACLAMSLASFAAFVFTLLVAKAPGRPGV